MNLLVNMGLINIQIVWLKPIKFLSVIHGLKAVAIRKTRGNTK